MLDPGNQIAELFHAVVDLTPEQRQDLYAARGIDADLRDEVESLLVQAPLPAFGDAALESSARHLADALAPSAADGWQDGIAVGDYEIVREIARGGMGVVYEARQRSLARRVAIKVVRDARFAHAAELQRFRAEAEAIARLDHTGIVPVYEVAQHDGQPYYSMAYLPGGSLKDLDTPLSPHRAAALIAPVCDAIHYAHTQNIVHRDLKPANVLLTESLQPRVSDFGLAKDVTEDSDLTYTGAILGTPGFMAPEQAAGNNDAVGHLADVYGLGAVLYYLLTGHPPIEGRTLVETLHEVVHGEVPDPRRHVAAIPADLAAICRKALEKSPVARYGSAAALADDLRRFERGEPIEARHLGSGQRVARWCKRRPALAALSAIAVTAVVGGSIVSYAFALDAREQATRLGRAVDELEDRNRELTAARDAANAAQSEAEAFRDFLLEDVVGSARPVGHPGALGLGVTVRDALLAALPRVAERFADMPVAEASARNELGVTLRHSDDREAALEQLHLALELRRRELGPDDLATLQSMNSVGATYHGMRRFDEAIAIYEELVDRARSHDAAFQFRVVNNLAANYERVERFDDQIALLESALTETTDEQQVLKLQSLLANAYAFAGRSDDARALLDELTEKLVDRTFDSVYFALEVESDIVACYEKLGADDRLSELLPGVITRARDILSPADPAVSRMCDILTKVYERLDMPAEAIELMRTQLAFDREHASRYVRKRAERLARLSLKTERFDVAIPAARVARDAWIDRDPNGAAAYGADVLLAEALIGVGRREEGRELLRSRIAGLREQKQNPPHARLLARFEEILGRD